MTEFQKLQNKALKYLGVRPRSQKEVTDYLQKKSTDQATINAVVEKFIKLKLIDDTAFATWYVESRSRSRPMSSWLLARELHQKGIDTTAVSHLTTDAEAVLAERALTKRLSRYSQLSWQEFRQRAGLFLKSRGFQTSLIEKILKKTYNVLHVNDEN